MTLSMVESMHGKYAKAAAVCSQRDSIRPGACTLYWTGQQTITVHKSGYNVQRNLDFNRS